MRCTRCQSENPPEYRFCGMCGTPLDKTETSTPVRSGEAARPEQPSRKSEPAPQGLSGPSFLGLGSEPARESSDDVTYLLEDEQPRRTYWRFTLLLLIVAIAGGLIWLQYRGSGGWVAPWANQKPSTPIQASQPPAEQQPQTSAQQTPPEVSGQPANQAPAGNPPGPKETDISPSGTQSAAAPENQPPATNNPAPIPPATPPAAAEPAKQPVEKPQTAEPGSKTAAEAGSSSSEPSTEAANVEPDIPTKAAKTSRVKPAPVIAQNPDESLVNSAEKYLYGRGVPQNCDRALISLRAAANRENARARSLLGTMYATGHCVPKDLPNAYRWFALASRQQADNMWIQRNLEMIWREMTPQERQLATQRTQ